MREENGTFQDLRPAHGGSEAENFVPLGGRASTPDARESGPAVGLAPRTSGQILDTAVDILRDRFGLYVLAASSIWFFVRLARPFVGLDEIDPFGSGDEEIQVFLLQLLDGLAQFLAQSLAVVFVALLAWPRVVGEPVRLGPAFGRALIVFVPLLFLQMAVGTIVVAGGLLTCGLGFFYFPWKTLLAPLCYTLERAGFGGALGRAWRLASHDGMSNEAFFGFLRWIAVYGTGYLLYTAVTGLVAAADTPGVKSTVLESTGMGELVYDGLYVVLTTLVIGTGSALFSIIVLAYYLDCRVRRDGFDLDQRLAALRARWSAPPQAGAQHEGGLVQP